MEQAKLSNNVEPIDHGPNTKRISALITKIQVATAE